MIIKQQISSEKLIKLLELLKNKENYYDDEKLRVARISSIKSKTDEDGRNQSDTLFKISLKIYNKNKDYPNDVLDPKVDFMLREILKIL